MLLVAFQAVMEWCLEYSDRVASGWKLVEREASTLACAGFFEVEQHWIWLDSGVGFRCLVVECVASGGSEVVGGVGFG